MSEVKKQMSFTASTDQGYCARCIRSYPKVIKLSCALKTDGIDIIECNISLCTKCLKELSEW